MVLVNYFTWAMSAPYYNGEKFPELLDGIKTMVLKDKIYITHPQDINEELLAIMAKHANICNYIPLPLQAGSNRILKDE